MPEVVQTPVHLVAVNVVYLHAFLARADECLPDKMMTETIGEMAHKRIARMAANSVTRLFDVWFEFFAGGVVELAVRAREEDFAFDALRRDLFDNRNIHKTANRRDGLSPKGGAKVEV